MSTESPGPAEAPSAERHRQPRDLSNAIDPLADGERFRAAREAAETLIGTMEVYFRARAALSLYETAEPFVEYDGLDGVHARFPSVWLDLVVIEGAPHETLKKKIKAAREQQDTSAETLRAAFDVAKKKILPGIFDDLHRGSDRAAGLRETVKRLFDSSAVDNIDAGSVHESLLAFAHSAAGDRFASLDAPSLRAALDQELFRAERNLAASTNENNGSHEVPVTIRECVDRLRAQTGDKHVTYDTVQKWTTRQRNPLRVVDETAKGKRVLLSEALACHRARQRGD